MFTNTIYFADAAAINVNSRIFGPGVGPIFLDNLGCRGNERNLNDCTHRGIGILGSCSHLEDAGVICLQGVVIRLFNIIPSCINADCRYTFLKLGDGHGGRVQGSHTEFNSVQQNLLIVKEGSQSVHESRAVGTAVVAVAIAPLTFLQVGTLVL